MTAGHGRDDSAAGCAGAPPSRKRTKHRTVGPGAEKTAGEGPGEGEGGHPEQPTIAVCHSYAPSATQSAGASDSGGAQAPPPASQLEHQAPAPGDDSQHLARELSAGDLSRRDDELLALRDGLVQNINDIEARWLRMATNGIRAHTNGMRAQIARFTTHHLAYRARAAESFARARRVEALITAAGGQPPMQSQQAGAGDTDTHPW